MPTKRCRMFASKNTTQSIKKKNQEAMPSCRSGITLEFFLNDHGDIDDEQAGQYCESYACAIPKDDVGYFDRLGVTCCF